MKTLRFFFSPFILLSILFLAACGSGETPTAVPEVMQTEVPSSASAQISISEIQKINWQWAELIENDPAAQSVVTDPENYTISFFDDGSFQVKADCNSGNGSYTTDGNRIEFGPMALTMAMCLPESQHDIFLQFLGQVDSFGRRDGKLVFSLKNNAGEMHFQNGGVAAKPEKPMEEKTIFIGPERIPCEGEGPQECYQVKETPEGEWQLFYDEIAGFQWEPGYIYELRVNVYQVENPPAGGSSLRYELVEVASKTLVETSNTTSIDPTSVTINTFDLPYTYQPNLVPAKPYNGTQPPGPTGLPQHIQVNFGVTSPSEVQPGDPVFYLIPVNDYQEMWDAAGDPGVKSTLDSLQKILSEQPDPIPAEGMPVLPYERIAGYNDLAVQGRYFTFDKGYGVRFVGRFNQDPNPVINEGLFYIFMGFSHDGNYLFSFFYPVETGLLPNSAAEVSDAEFNRLNQDTAAYLAERAQSLNTLAPADWLPSLETLDSVVSSLSYTSMPNTGSSQSPSLVNVQWQWSRFIDPVQAFDIPNPSQYQLFFATDGTFNFQADCNSGTGSYQADGGSITLEVTSITQALCGDESLSDQFLENLGFVRTYTFNDTQLILDLMADGGQMIFDKE